MKKLKSIVLSIALLAAVGIASAAEIPAERLSKNYAINTYINAMCRGKLQGMYEVLDPTVKFSMLRGTTVLSYSKTEMLNFMKGEQNVEQTCTVSTLQVESNENVSVVKVDMKYNGFVRRNYVTIANTGEGWKITSVYSVFI